MVEMKYQESEVIDVKIAATSPVEKLVDQLRNLITVPGMKWRLGRKNVLLKYDGLEVEDWNQQVVNFSLHLPFVFGKYACMHACLNGSTQYWLCRFQANF